MADLHFYAGLWPIFKLDTKGIGVVNTTTSGHKWYDLLLK